MNRSKGYKRNPPHYCNRLLIRYPDSFEVNAPHSVIVRRGSTRRFSYESIGFDQLSTIREVVSDALFNQVHLLVSAVDGLHPRACFLDAEAEELVLLKAGASLEDAGHLCLEQPLLVQAAASFQ